MNRVMKRLWSSKITVLGAGAAVLVFAVGYIIGGRGSEARKEPIAHEHQEDQAENREKKGVLHVCPMNCVAPMEKPGRCPVCGMELVAVPSRVYGGEADLPRISLPEKTLKRSGIQVARVEEKFVTAEIRLFGKIEYDPIEQFKVTAFAPGVIDNIYVKRAGQVVRRGDPLFDLNSAELFYLEHEFFETLEKLPLGVDLVPGKGHSESRVGRWQRLLLPPKEPGEKPELSPEANKAIQQSMGQIKRKMRLLGLSDKDVEGLIIKGRPTGISTVTSPMTGVVLEQNAFRGTFVNTGDVVFTIANPRVLWARLDAYAADFPWLRLGQEAEFTTDAYPGKTFKGKVLFLDPEFDAKRKVFKVGVLYRDSMGLLKPNMLVRCVIHAKLTAGGRGMAEMVTQGMMETAQTRRTNAPPLVIPDTAPLITGKRAVVYVEESGEPGTYVGREVDLGPRASGYYLVNAGLKKGEKVVVNGNFKIDSAVQILAKSSMMSQKVSPLPVEHYDYVETPPLPEELEAERPDKGPKHDFHTGQVPKPKDMTESHD